MKRSLMSAMAIALSAAAYTPQLTFQGGSEVASDPYKRKARSKGEKARNRKNRG